MNWKILLGISWFFVPFAFATLLSYHEAVEIEEAADILLSLRKHNPPRPKVTFTFLKVQERFGCPHCSLTYSSPDSVKRHLRKKHKSRSQKVKLIPV